jgi:ZIP family zinc transporter
MIIWISIATLVSTLLGGMFALRFKDKLHLILGFSAGVIIGVAFFDLLPEAINREFQDFLSLKNLYRKKVLFYFF